MKKWLGLIVAFLIAPSAIALHTKISPIAPQPSACISSDITSSGDRWWRSVNLKLTNNCGSSVDFQNANVNFENKTSLNTNFWGEFSPLPYPDNNLRITSQPLSNGNFLSSLHLHFPTYPGADTRLPNGRSITIKYGAATDAPVSGTVKVFVESPVGTGSISIKNESAQPSNVSQNYAIVHVALNGQNVAEVQLPWLGSRTVSDLAAGTYAIKANSVTDTSGNTYQGLASPASVSVSAGQTANVSVRYTMTQESGKIAIQLQSLPSELSGYTAKPSVVVNEVGSSASTATEVSWGQEATVSNLKSGTRYQFSTPSINHNGYQCQPSFSPTTVIASATTTPRTTLSYTCSQVAQTRVTLNVTGGPSSLSSLRVTLTPNNATAPVVETISLTNGSGSSSLSLMTGIAYTVSADPVPNYTLSFNPQPLTATANAIETITLTPTSTGGTPVSRHGQLKVCGTQLCDEHGVAIQLKGMSSHGIQWYGWGSCLTAASIDALANDFKANVMRISMYIQEGGYETNPTAFTNQVSLLIEEATKRGIYAVIDWHMLTPGDPNYNLERAKTFFTAIATQHGGKNNLIYEIANEPNGVSWSAIKTYSEALIPVIRAIDPRSPIIVGTRGWSSLGMSEGSNAQEIISNPVNASNIMYAFHFYTASHRESYLNELDRASDALPIFASEFGTQTFSGDGANDFAMADRYMELMARKKISWTNWNYSDDFRSGAIWKVGTCPQGPWTDANLKPAGLYIKGKIMN